MVLTVKAPPPLRYRPPPDPPPSKPFSVAFETLTSIIPPEPPDPPDSSFIRVLRLRDLASIFNDLHSVSLQTLTQAWDFKTSLSDLEINSGVTSLGPSYLSNKPCEGIVYVPLWNKLFLRKVNSAVCRLKLYLPQCEDITLSVSHRMRSSLPLFEDDKLPISPLLPRYEDVPRASILLALFHDGSFLWSLRSISLSLSPFPLWLIGEKKINVGFNPINLVSLRLDFSSMEFVLFPKIPYALSGVVTTDMVQKMVLSVAETMTSLASSSEIFDTDLLAMMALETLMSLFCVVWSCQDTKEVTRALVGSALMVEVLKLCSDLLKDKEFSLLSFHILSDSQVFISTLCLGFVLNEISGVLHDGRSLATLFNPLSFSFICIDYVQVVSLAKASLECMIVENVVF